MNWLDNHPVWRGLLVSVALLLLSLTAMQPFLQGDMPRTDDGNLHLYRALALEHAIDSTGNPYPRYAPGIVHGYGAALFNYYPPLPYYLITGMHALGIGYVQAWLASMAFFTWLAAAGAFLLGRFWSNMWGGFVTAIAYAYAPYMLFNSVTRGTTSEVAALALLPWVMWAFSRLAREGGAGNFLRAALLYALFIPVHNISTLHGTLLLMAYCAYLWAVADDGRRVVGQLFSAGVVALLISAFFWLPALAETDYAKIEGVTQNLAFVDVTNSLRPLSEIFALPQTADPTQLRPLTPITLGLPQMILALLGLCVPLTVRLGWHNASDWFSDESRPAAHVSLQALAWVLIVLLIFLQLPASERLWQSGALSLLDYTQFAWRTLGPASLLLALLAGIGAAQSVALLRAETPQMAFYGVCLLLLAGYGLPWLYTSYTALETDSIVDVQEYELQRGELALSSYSEYLPAWNLAPLDADKLRPAFEQNPLRVSRLSPPEGVTIERADWRGTSVDFFYTADDTTTLTFDWLYVPGWQAELDGETLLVVEPTVPQGFVSVTVPQGTHTLRVWLADTALQRTAEWVSIFAFAGLILGVRVWQRVTFAEKIASQEGQS